MLRVSIYGLVTAAPNCDARANQNNNRGRKRLEAAEACSKVKSVELNAAARARRILMQCSRPVNTNRGRAARAPPSPRAWPLIFRTITLGVNSGANTLP
ncbi:hypothetical protein EVAR_46655_1 [Eumeta japonica]|uniref:Uncharacterized protein n=1 Tax=Eumeta variegata TaxID=151549 RepID=A0A4C1Y3R0_EUMVA|nr:hypothetical protein EVAR_46655_1 [Eumeta japonica]